MIKVHEIVEYFEKMVPPEMKLDFDNVGLLVGMRQAEVKKALVALDITSEVVDEAIAEGAQIILSHHPLFFELKRICDDDVNGSMIIKLIQNGISAFCQHTNLDQVTGGVNDALANILGVSIEGYLSEEQHTSSGVSYGMGHYGFLKTPMSLQEFLPCAKAALKADGFRYHDAGRQVSKLALCGGSGGMYVDTAVSLGCDTIVTADIKHNEFLTAKAKGINVIDGGHYYTENVVVPVLADMLKKAFPELEVAVSRRAGAPMEFYCG